MAMIHRWESKTRIFVFLLLSFGYWAWSYTSELGALGGDNAVYLLMAEHLSPFSPGSVLSSAYFTTSQYPPLFPMALGLFGANNNLLIAHLLVTSFLIIALVALYKWQRSLAISSWPAFFLTLLFALLPGTYFQTLEILSENLYLLLSLLGLWAYQRVGMDGRGNAYFAAAIAIAAATLTRTAGAALLAAFLIHLLLVNRPGRRDLIAVAIALVPVAVWHLWRGGGGYAASLASTYTGSPVEVFLDRLGIQAAALWAGWVDNFISTSPFALVVAVTVFGAICLAGLALRVYERTLDGLYVTFYLLLMLVWPFPGESKRFMFPIVPILMVHGLWFLQNVPRVHFAARRISLATPAVLTAIALVTLPQLLLHLNRFATPLPAELSAFKRTVGWYHPDPNLAAYQIYQSARLVTAMKAAASIVPAEECIVSIKPSVTSLYTKRMSKSPPASAASLDDDFERELKMRGCSYFFLVSFASPTFRDPFYPLSRLKDRAEILQQTRLADSDSPLVAVLARVSLQQGSQ